LNHFFLKKKQKLFFVLMKSKNSRPYVSLQHTIKEREREKERKGIHVSFHKPNKHCKNMNQLISLHL